MSELSLGLDRHHFECPHCNQTTEHFWAGALILYSSATCQHCSAKFLIVENKPLAEIRAPA